MQKPLRGRGWGAMAIRSLLAALVVLVCLFVMRYTDNGLLVASVGASAFIVFTAPRNRTARSKVLVGGYLCGIVAGLAGFGLCWLLPGTLSGDGFGAVAAGSVLAMFLATFLMLALSLRHPPAAALAISLVATGQPLRMGATALFCIMVIAVAKWLQLRLPRKMKPG